MHFAGWTHHCSTLSTYRWDSYCFLWCCKSFMINCWWSYLIQTYSDLHSTYQNHHKEFERPSHYVCIYPALCSKSHSDQQVVTPPSSPFCFSPAFRIFLPPPFFSFARRLSSSFTLICCCCFLLFCLYFYLLRHFLFCTHPLSHYHTVFFAHTYTFYSPHPRLWVPFRLHATGFIVVYLCIYLCVAVCELISGVSQWGCINWFSTSFSLQLSDEQQQDTVLLGHRDELTC